MREEFEKHMAGKGYGPDAFAHKWDNGNYRTTGLQWAWEDWQSAYAAALEKAAETCDGISDDKWQQYKGRAPHEPMNPHRADPQTQGESCGAASCAEAIRKMKG